MRKFVGLPVIVGPKGMGLSLPDKDNQEGDEIEIVNSAPIPLMCGTVWMDPDARMTIRWDGKNWRAVGKIAGKITMPAEDVGK